MDQYIDRCTTLIRGGLMCVYMKRRSKGAYMSKVIIKLRGVACRIMPTTLGAHSVFRGVVCVWVGGGEQ